VQSRGALQVLVRLGAVPNVSAVGNEERGHTTGTHSLGPYLPQRSMLHLPIIRVRIEIVA
jgi:hypothetical protein